MISTQYSLHTLKWTDPQKWESRRQIVQQSKLVKFTLHGLCIKQYFCSKDPFFSWHWIWFLKIICPFFPSTPPNLENMIANPHLGQEFWYKNLPFVYINTVISKTSFAIMRSLWEPRKYQGNENKMVSILTLVCKFISIIRKKIACSKWRFQNSANLPICNVLRGLRNLKVLQAPKRFWQPTCLMDNCSEVVHPWSRYLLP